MKLLLKALKKRKDLIFERPGGKEELKLLWLMSRVPRLGSSKTDGGKGPSKAFPLKLRWFRVDKWRISGGIGPERLRRERSREMIREVLGSHLTPDHEHQSGRRKAAEVGSQPWKVERGSFREDFKARREMSWGSGGGAEKTRVILSSKKKQQDAESIKKEEEEKGLLFMVWRLWWKR